MNPIKCIVISLLIFSSAKAMEYTERDMIDALLGKKNYSPEVIDKMDDNLDGKLDVGDIVKFSDAVNEKKFVGNQWVVTVTYGAEEGAHVPQSYSFILNVPQPPAAPFVGTLKDEEPTRSVLHQKLRFPYLLTKLIPPGLNFSLSENTDQIILESDTNLLPADNKVNPAAVPIVKSWNLIVNKKSLSGQSPSNGFIIEKIQGFLPADAPLEYKGKIFLQLVGSNPS